MAIKEQSRLLEHYEGIASNKIKDKGGRDFKPIIRENARKHAEDILVGYPALAEKPKEKPKEKK